MRLALGHLDAFQILPKITGTEEIASQVTVKEKSVKLSFPFQSLYAVYVVWGFFNTVLIIIFSVIWLVLQRKSVLWICWFL